MEGSGRLYDRRLVAGSWLWFEPGKTPQVGPTRNELAERK